MHVKYKCCLWGLPQHCILYFGSCFSQDGIPLTDPKFYSKVTSAELDHILRSDNPNAKVPLLEDRVTCLHQVGKKLLEKYRGRGIYSKCKTVVVNNCLKSFDNNYINFIFLLTSLSTIIIFRNMSICSSFRATNNFRST